MKKILLITFLFLIAPLKGDATIFKLDDIGMNITFDESLWYVFTPDNILNNSELEELGVSYEYMYEAFLENQAYVDAILFYQDTDDYIEVFVRRTKVDFDDFTKSNISDVKYLGALLAEEQNATYEIYQTDLIFVRMDYIDQDLYLNEYYTIQDGYMYALTAQKPNSFDSYDKNIVKKVVDSISIEKEEEVIEESKEEVEKEKEEEEEKTIAKKDNKLLIIITIILASLIVLGTVLVIRTRKNKA